MEIKKSTLLMLVLMVSILLVGFSISSARMEYDIDHYLSQMPIGKTMADEDPYVDYGVHDKGRIGFTVTNQGHLGTGFLDGAGANLPSCQYPYPSQQNYFHRPLFLYPK